MMMPHIFEINQNSIFCFAISRSRAPLSVNRRSLCRTTIVGSIIFADKNDRNRSLNCCFERNSVAWGHTVSEFSSFRSFRGAQGSPAKCGTSSKAASERLFFAASLLVRFVSFASCQSSSRLV
jgi:hypothetical protein